jgi:hypothetical protein
MLLLGWLAAAGQPADYARVGEHSVSLCITERQSIPLIKGLGQVLDQDNMYFPVVMCAGVTYMPNSL